MEERIREAAQTVGIGKLVISRPPNPAFGDYSFFAGEKAVEVAASLTQALGNSVQAVQVAGNGFVNITLSREVITLAVLEAGAQAGEWGKGKIEEGKRVMVEYSNPNAFKEMHIGHLVGTVVGEALSRLIENTGATVARDTFGGDVGPNVAKALWGLHKAGIIEPTTAQELGIAYAAGSAAYETDPQAKEEIDALNKAIYSGSDRELMELWRKGREVSMQEFRRIWKLLGSHFDFEFFDSDTSESGVRIVLDGLSKGIFEKSDGAVIYNGEKKGVHTMVFITSHNTPTYEAKDLGLAFLKEERWPSDHSIILTANEQTGRFKTVLGALEDIAPLLSAKTTHLATGFLKLTSGKMSSREGNVITAAEFITHVLQHASEKNSDPLVAEQVAIGAIKYMILRQSLGSDIIFDEEKSLSLEGDSGPYLQYALVRARSVLAQAASAGDTSAPEAAYLVERILLHYPEVAARAAREYAPNLLVNYLIELAGEWNAFYAKERIIGGDFESYKLRIARAFVQTMVNGLTLLGIPAPEKM
jgi:arginyl-tRNA synthetase